jgi:hypothetical protein
MNSNEDPVNPNEDPVNPNKGSDSINDQVKKLLETAPELMRIVSTLMDKKDNVEIFRISLRVNELLESKPNKVNETIDVRVGNIVEHVDALTFAILARNKQFVNLLIKGGAVVRPYHLDLNNEFAENKETKEIREALKYFERYKPVWRHPLPSQSSQQGGRRRNRTQRRRKHKKQSRRHHKK